MDSQLILPPVVSFTVAVIVAWLLPRFSRNFLGPAVIILTLIGCVMYVNQASHAHSDAWGPAALIIALYVGGVGVVSGLILVTLGASRGDSAVTPPSVTYSKEKPYQLPRPGLFTPARLFVVIVLVSLTPVIIELSRARKHRHVPVAPPERELMGDSNDDPVREP